MKKFLVFQISVLFLLLTSCSNLLTEDKGSVTLSFNGSDLCNSRNITANATDNNYYVVVSLSGDSSDSKNLRVSSSGSYSVTFDAIEIGSRIKVSAYVYKPSAEMVHPNQNTEIPVIEIFEGQSDFIEIDAGNNDITLSMKDLTKNLYPMEYNPSPYEFYYNGTEVSFSGMVSINYYNNHKYQIILTIDNEDKIISEGTWSGDLFSVGTIYMTENLYNALTISVVDNISYRVHPSDEYVILDQPNQISIPMNGDFVNGSMHWYNFTLTSGLKIVISES